MSSMSAKRERLLSDLRNQSSDPEADHISAEALLVDWLRGVDVELAEAWEKASEDWWYA